MVDFLPSTAEVITFLDLFGGQGFVTLAPGARYTSQVIDVRDLASYFFEVEVDTSGTGTSMNACEIEIYYWPTTDGFGTGSSPIYKDTYAVWSQQSGTAGGIFDCPAGTVFLQDGHHGPYCQVVFFAPATNTQSLLITGTMLGSTRQLAGPYARQQIVTADSGDGSGTDGILAYSGSIAIANGVTQNVPCALAYGDIRYRVSTGAGGITYFFRYAGIATTIESVTLAANSVLAEQPFVVPKRALLISPRNTSGVASATSTFVKSTYNKI